MDNEKNEKKRFRSVEKEVVKEVIQNDDGTETVIYGTEIVEEEVPDTADPDAFGADRVWEDDGTAFANMDITRRPKHRKRRNSDEIKLTKKERRAIIGAAYLKYLPALLLVIGAFALVFFLGWLLLTR